MIHIILIFGVVIVLAGAVILFNPGGFAVFFRRHLDSVALQVIAVVVRLILGVALISYGAESKFPITLVVIGCISLAAALTLGVIGRARFKSLMNWAIDLTLSYGRFGGLLALLFGGFLIYAVI